MFETVTKNDPVVKCLFCASTIEEKRNWLRDIKTIVKNFQKRDYNENKEQLLKGLFVFLKKL